MAADPQRLQTTGDGGPSTDSAHPLIGGLTVRSIVMGLVLVVGLDALAIYVRYIYHGSLMTYSHIPMARIAPGR
jgi:hypothetical protein|tara:strand:+ start:234 stop:455 length:222 start_codon:yes stop_codon:yes gene_type:complete